MVATATKPKTLELLESGDLEAMLKVPDEAVRHGDNVFLQIAWKDQSLVPEVVAAEIEVRLRAMGAIPADGHTRMVFPDPGFLRVTINYKEQSPELGMILAVVGGIVAIGAVGSFLLFRTQTENVLGPMAGGIITTIAVVGLVIAGFGIFAAMQEARGGRAIRG